MKLYFSFIFVLLQTIAASAVEYEGRMRCKIIYQELVNLNDGRVEIYTGYKDSYKLGDELILSYTFSSFDDSGYNMYLELKDNARDKIVENIVYIGAKGEKITVAPSGRVSFWNVIDFPNSPPDVESLTFTDDIIRVDGWGEMYFERYYKNDFHGVIKNLTSANSTHIIMVDCRTELDARDEIRKHLIRSNN